VLVLRTPETHWDAAICIVRYLMRASGPDILFRNNGHLRVEGFIDTDWVRSPLDRRFTPGYCTFLGGNLVTWKCKKQNVVAQLSTEA
jgi:hypothetical protein